MHSGILSAIMAALGGNSTTTATGALSAAARRAREAVFTVLKIGARGVVYGLRGPPRRRYLRYCGPRGGISSNVDQPRLRYLR